MQTIFSLVKLCNEIFLNIVHIYHTVVVVEVVVSGVVVGSVVVVVKDEVGFEVAAIVFTASLVSILVDISVLLELIALLFVVKSSEVVSGIKFKALTVDCVTNPPCKVVCEISGFVINCSCCVVLTVDSILVTSNLLSFHGERFKNVKNSVFLINFSLTASASEVNDEIVDISTFIFSSGLFTNIVVFFDS